MRRSSDNYIRLNKKITNKEIIKGINSLSADWLVSAQDVCYKMICEGIIRERKKKEEFNRIIGKQNE